jgi:outer membrane protein assembly factor BamA
LVAVLAVAACHHAVRRPSGEWLSDVRFRGNVGVSTDRLREGLALERVQKSHGTPDPYLISSDAERIRGIYVRRGYLEARVLSKVEHVGQAVNVTFTIEEGTRSTTRVVIRGLPRDPTLPIAKVRAVIPLHDGDPFDYDVYDQAKGPLLRVVQDAGYAHAQLETRVLVVRPNHVAMVELEYVPGPKCRFGPIVISGAPDELTEAVRRRLTFKQGDVFSMSAIVDSQRAIFGMNRFSTARIRPDKDTGEVVGVHVGLARSSLHALGLGGGFGIDPATYEVRARASYSQIDWPWPLTDLTLDLRPAYTYLRDGGGFEPRIRALAKLTRIDLFRPYVVADVGGGYNYLAFEAYTSYGPVAATGIESPIVTKRVRARLGWGFEYASFTNINGLIDPVTQAELGLDRPERLGELQQTVVVDLRDNLVETRLGAYGEVRLAEGAPFLASNFSFLQITPEVRGFVPLGPVVAAGRVRFGTFIGDVPPTERYYSGGAVGQRGFSERRLAPTVFAATGDDSVPVGGGALIETSAELRMVFGTIRGMRIGGVAFLDGGNCTNTLDELFTGGLFWAAGPGVRVFTPVGAVRVDFGYRLNKTGPMEPEPNSNYAFHISLGEAY